MDDQTQPASAEEAAWLMAEMTQRAEARIAADIDLEVAQ